MGQAKTGVDVFFCHKTEDKIKGLVSKTLCPTDAINVVSMAQSATTLVVQPDPGSVIVASMKSESNQMFRPIGKQKMLEEITSCKYPKRRWQ